jgi:hypothetical protein
MKQYGFNEQHRGENAPRFLSLDLEATDPITQQMQYLTQQAPEVMHALTELQTTNLRNALRHAEQQHIDPQLHNLYGALFSLQQHQQLSLLDKPFTITKLYEHTQHLNSLTTKQNIAEEHATYLSKTLQIDNPIYISEIQNLLASSTPKNRNQLLRAFFDEHQIPYDPKITYNEFYLSSLNPNKEPELIANLNIKGKKYSLVSLITKAQMQAESEALGHCVGKSDFYIEKVRDKKILVLSLRKYQGNLFSKFFTKNRKYKPQYTLEYDIKTQTLKQFKGKDNKLPDDDTVITTTLDAIVQAGYPVRQYNETLE